MDKTLFQKLEDEVISLNERISSLESILRELTDKRTACLTILGKRDEDPLILKNTSKHKGPRINNLEQKIAAVFKEVKKPLSVDEIISNLKQRGVISEVHQSPKTKVYGAITRCRDLFKKTGHGLWELNENLSK